ncbi:MAG: hypothetical protein ABH859_05285 [Pseudomonadota bacterium]
MKRMVFAVLALIVFIGISANAHAWGYARKGHFRLGVFAPGVFVGNKGIDGMLSVGLEGEYFILENLSASFRIEEATDFKIGASPHSVLNFVARARYVFDIGNSGNWAAYVQGGLGGAIIGKSHGAFDLAIPGGGFWYQWYQNWFIGLDCSMHILIRNPTAIAFDVTPSIRYQF